MRDIEDAMGVATMTAGFQSREISPVEVVRAAIARIERCEPQLRALYAFDPREALAAAMQSEQRWKHGQQRSALDGVPVTIKENIATRGTPTPLGTAASDLRPAENDAPPAARLREAGAVLLAKTTMPDYGMLSSGLSSFHALTRNPWNLDCNPGGSSAGAAAATAAGYAPINLGTDIGGSIRLPAGWCGVVGFKPSNGRVPIDPPYVGRCAGPLARSVDDAARAMAILSGPDARDHMSLPPAPLDWAIAPARCEGLRLGLMMDAGCGLSTEPQVARAVEAAARLFAQAGAHVEPMAPLLTREMLDGVDRFWRARAWADVSALPKDRRAAILPYIRAWAESGEHLSGAEVFHGFSQIMAMRATAHAASQRYDFVLCPTAPIAAFAAGLPSPTNDVARPFEHIAFTVAFNMSEQPALSINCGYTDDGLPIGLQIVGRRFDDIGVLSLARAFEDMRPPQRPWPMQA